MVAADRGRLGLYCILYSIGIQVEYHFDINSNKGGSVVSDLYLKKLRGSLTCAFAIAIAWPIMGYSPALAQQPGVDERVEEIRCF